MGLTTLIEYSYAVSGSMMIWHVYFSRHARTYVHAYAHACAYTIDIGAKPYSLSCLDACLN